MNYSENIKDIIATASLLIKFGCEDILNKQETFVSFLNELGFRSPTGEEFTRAGFRQMMKRLPIEQREELIEMFNQGHRDVNHQMMMYSNN
ncbi:asiA [Aeromonas phage 31]|uniref:Anti-sigma 70 protein n=4 Tax=Biquartavirus TaxID=1912143 RepID=Q6U976_9CAUD|nr:anti-sigma factor [Aeromonas phage 44RR2.8t]YP_238952.1 anti-sigma factor [Aeromonas phage 31]APU00698.1 anti-sigma factor [Aeromonas phage 44RR2.8t.2]APU01117.1 anti-sigma factor [Aeromonas phage 31.2]APU02027.1 anti-sigma factor [Aeromonas phage L9-6]APU02278.1 anti-sigma factor [Aeromonas phage Riv-10]APU02526.1 anti-sigma factor [Aeromonas phage SW69-9]UYD59535.1 10 kDa anti-sigma factor [Aeromonas phage avDM5]UYD60491.1 10 kDa anti-sigma factor [Aeromonas phage avDM2]